MLEFGLKINNYTQMLPWNLPVKDEDSYGNDWN